MNFDKKRVGIAFILLGVLTGCGTSHGIGENALQPKSTVAFPSVVQQVMTSVKGHTTIPLLAPTFMPTASGYLTATTQPGGVSPKSYHVNVFATKSPVAVNTSSLANSTYPEVASFGASRFASSSQAISAIHAWNANEGLIPRPPEKKSTTALGDSVNATVYKMGNVTSIQWQTGRWLFEVNDNLNVARTALAKQIVRFAHQTPFPGSDQAGIVIINVTTTGAHENIQSLVIGTRGPILYSEQTTKPLNALRMAVSMKQF